MGKQISEVLEIMDRYKESPVIYFKNLTPSMLEEDLKVVYAISNKNTDSVLYVGRTKKLRRRLYTNHLQGNKSTARLKKYLVEDNDNFPNITDYNEAKLWIKENCYFKYIQVNDSRERGHIEGLLGYMLDSLYIEEEH
ncbi:hypothetical protein EHW71_02455 [Clostridium butyricum]|jgi:predicted GIY-YIG superfamily endonuclease|uniref:GIY-YIG nuclease family protein n=1 Tax=Clostridium butyricum TaxID=1492 RepID=UPI000F52CA2C|nr:GIY-YIG nuclease family protein [Clostridium butyricum]RQN12497.1 hypothetical protein EHW71_02455 [Clostridium butyricum]